MAIPATNCHHVSIEHLRVAVIAWVLACAIVNKVCMLFWETRADKEPLAVGASVGFRHEEAREGHEAQGPQSDRAERSSG